MIKKLIACFILAAFGVSASQATDGPAQLRANILLGGNGIAYRNAITPSDDDPVLTWDAASGTYVGEITMPTTPATATTNINYLKLYSVTNGTYTYYGPQTEMMNGGWAANKVALNFPKEGTVLTEKFVADTELGTSGPGSWYVTDFAGKSEGTMTVSVNLTTNTAVFTYGEPGDDTVEDSDNLFLAISTDIFSPQPKDTDQYLEPGANGTFTGTLNIPTARRFYFYTRKNGVITKYTGNDNISFNAENRSNTLQLVKDGVGAGWLIVGNSLQIPEFDCTINLNNLTATLTVGEEKAPEALYIWGSTQGSTGRQTQWGDALLPIAEGSHIYSVEFDVPECHFPLITDDPEVNADPTDVDNGFYFMFNDNKNTMSNGAKSYRAPSDRRIYSIPAPEQTWESPLITGIAFQEGDDQGKYFIQLTPGKTKFTVDWDELTFTAEMLEPQTAGNTVTISFPNGYDKLTVLDVTTGETVDINANPFSYTYDRGAGLLFAPQEGYKVNITCPTPSDGLNYLIQNREADEIEGTPATSQLDLTYLCNGYTFTVNVTPLSTSTSETIQFSYADENARLGALGYSSGDSYDVAMGINNPAMAGMKVTAITAYLNPYTDVSNGSLWISSGFELTGNTFVPDIRKVEVNPVRGSYAGDNDVAVMTITLDEPYVLPETPVYIGYSITIDQASGEAQKHPVIYSANAYNEMGFFWRAASNGRDWTDASDYGNATIYVTLEVENANSLGIRSIDEAYTLADEGFNANVNVFNVGIYDVNSITYSYSIDGGELQNNTVILTTPIPVDQVKAYTQALPINGISEIGPHNVTLTITEINGQPNTSDVATGAFTANVVPFKPKHRPLVEEFTGLWCGWCPRGFLGMEKIAEIYGDDQVSICYHNASQGPDPMSVSNSNPMGADAYPGGSVDRQAVVDPWYGSSNNVNFGIGQDVDQALEKFAIADIEVEATLDGDIVTATATTKFVVNQENTNYRLGFVLVANNLYNSTWAQTNYFPQYKRDFAGTPLEVLCNMGGKIYGQHYNDVAVDVTNMNGTRGLFPANITVDTPYVNEFSFNIANNKVIQDRSQLIVVAFVANPDGTIVNANKFCFPGAAGVQGVDSEDATVVSTVYYDLTGRKVANPDHGIYIRSEKLSDGTVRNQKIAF